MGGIDQSMFVGGERTRRFGNAAFKDIHRQQAPDDARRAHQYLLRLATDRTGGQLRHAAGVLHALLASASVGVARTDDYAARVGARQTFLAKLDGGGTNAVLRIDAGGGGRPIADDQRQIATIRLRPEAAMNARQTKAL